MSCKNMVHEPFANFKDLQNVIRDKWHDVDIRQSESEKLCCSGKKHLSVMAKQNGGLTQTFSAD